jgi:hypothetical protein
VVSAIVSAPEVEALLMPRTPPQISNARPTKTTPSSSGKMIQTCKAALNVTVSEKGCIGPTDVAFRTFRSVPAVCEAFAVP